VVKKSEPRRVRVARRIIGAGFFGFGGKPQNNPTPSPAQKATAPPAWPPGAVTMQETIGKAGYALCYDPRLTEKQAQVPYHAPHEATFRAGVYPKTDRFGGTNLFVTIDGRKDNFGRTGFAIAYTYLPPGADVQAASSAMQRMHPKQHGPDPGLRLPPEVFSGTGQAGNSSQPGQAGNTPQPGQAGNSPRPGQTSLGGPTPGPATHPTTPAPSPSTLHPQVVSYLQTLKQRRLPRITAEQDAHARGYSVPARVWDLWDRSATPWQG
jgi:hypothetical protein